MEAYLTDEEIYATWGVAKNEAYSFREFARAIESAVLEKLKAQEQAKEPVGWYFMDDPQVVAMPGSGYFPGSTPPNDAINLVPLYTHPDPRVAELEAVLRECREALVPYMQYVDGTKVLNHPAQCVAKIDEVLK